MGTLMDSAAKGCTGMGCLSRRTSAKIIRASAKVILVHGMLGYCALNLSLLGNSMGTPMGIAPATRTRPVQYPYLQPHGFSHQNEPKNVEIGQEMRDLWLISMNFTKSAVTPSVFVRKLRF